MLANLKLRGRIFTGFSIPVVLGLGFSGLVFFIGNQLLEALTQVERTQQIVVQTDIMVLRTSMMARQVRGYLLVKSEEPLKEFRNQKQLYDRAVEAAKNLIKDPVQQQIFKEMIQLGDQYYEMCLETFRLKDAGQHNQAVNLYLKESKAMVGQLDHLGEKANQNERKIMESYTRSASNAVQSLILAAVLTAVLSLVLSSAAASVIWGTIAKTNRTMNQTANTIATSSTQIAVSVEQQERNASQQATSVNETTTTMNELSSSSRATVQQAESSAETARQVLKLAESSVAGATQVLNLAENGATGARQVLSLAQGGTQTVERTLEGISILKDKVTNIAEQIGRLNEQAYQISSITNIVRDLANQTNMLALNAAVEAVRAGEQGKGFGVVATEIRKLADQSKKSADKINGLVLGIQSAINSTVLATEEGRKTAQESIHLSQETAEAFNQVTQSINEIILKSSLGVAEAINSIVLHNQKTSLEAIENVVVNNQQISLTAKQQAVAIEQVVEAMNSLNQGAVQTASGLAQTKIGLQKLNEASQSLKAAA
ncbi:MAG: CHASE3 domain-containing protein [Microcoleus vaginatus WJT46-NPBG5]|jgi:methyl-accepting chemotaxis protein|nr:CHASE3 domain-containing protein [Microcoleus vaginatus WJT46-NPBG5]